jgi:hypothetical protein
MISLRTTALALFLALAGVGASAGAASAAPPANPVPVIVERAALPTGPDAVVQPDSCQAASATLTLETTARGYTYDCTGSYTNAAGTTAYYVFAGGWSGVLYTSGATYLYCDGAQFGVGYYTVYSIYLSPTKESWC